jgi:hypothetical protein
VHYNPTSVAVAAVMRLDRERKRQSSKHDDFSDDDDDDDDSTPASSTYCLERVSISPLQRVLLVSNYRFAAATRKFIANVSSRSNGRRDELRDGYRRPKDR